MVILNIIWCPDSELWMLLLARSNNVMSLVYIRALAGQQNVVGCPVTAIVTTLPVGSKISTERLPWEGLMRRNNPEFMMWPLLLEPTPGDAWQNPTSLAKRSAIPWLVKLSIDRFGTDCNSVQRGKKREIPSQMDVLASGITWRELEFPTSCCRLGAWGLTSSREKTDRIFKRK